MAKTSKQKTTKQQPDLARADELVLGIGNMVLEDENIRAADWAALSLVIDLDGRRGLFAYLYDEDGNGQPEVLAETNVIALAEELRELMIDEGEPWKAMLLQVFGDELRMSFDYEGSEWKLDGDNTVEMVEKLRPELPRAAKKKKPAKKAAKPAAKKVAPKKKVAAKKPAAKKAVAKKPVAKKKKR